jgi:hypothetical protein
MSVKRLASVFVLALVISATAATAASARPTDAVGASVSDPAAYATDETAVSSYATPNSILGPSEPSDSTASANPNSGFDWGDAGIGAGAAFAVTMIGLGGLLVVSSRRHRRQGSPAAV